MDWAQSLLLVISVVGGANILVMLVWKIADHRREIDKKLQTVRDEMHSFEKWARDEFARKLSMNAVTAELRTDVKDLGKKMEAGFSHIHESMNELRKDLAQ